METSELNNLLSGEEILLLRDFLIQRKYSADKDGYIFTGYFQEFLSTLEENRRIELIEIMSVKYPRLYNRVVGMEPCI